MDAIYYLKENEEIEDDFLLPSLFYMLKWAYHTPRTACAAYTYYE